MAARITRFNSTLAVWNALFLREALSRLFARRGLWFWLLLEPVFHVSYMVVIYTIVRVRVIGGIDVVIWIIVGMLGFFMFRRTSSQLTNAVSVNQALFIYRQVKPIDTVLVRAGLEGFLMVIIISIILTGAELFGHSIIPVDPLAVLEAFGGLWLVGLGWGLVASVTIEMIPELRQIFAMAMRPLYLLSGVMLPIAAVPMPYRDWLLLNPVAHGLEAARLGFAPEYAAVPGLSVSYIYEFALVTIFMGLALHRRFTSRLVTR